MKISFKRAELFDFGRLGSQIPVLNCRLLRLSPLPRVVPSYLGSIEKFLALQGEVEEMIKKQAIEEVAHPNPGFYNRLFLVPKQGELGARY